jgi:ATP-dependent Lon protease
MTGEITLRGRVLPVGGLKEKLLAAHRTGVSKVIIPAQNEKDLQEIPADVKKSLEVVLANRMSVVLENALNDEDEQKG